MDVSGLGAALGAVVGLILALTGAGGGILAVPLLVFGMHLTIAQAAPVGLMAVGIAAAVGALLGLREGIVRYRAAALLGFSGMVFAPLGVWLAKHLPNTPLLLGFSVVLAYTAWRMFRQTLHTGKTTGEAMRTPDAPDYLPCIVQPGEQRLSWSLPCARALGITGMLSGTLSGLLGVGGGFVIVPALSRYTNLATRSILATSLAVIALVAVGGVAAAAAQGSVAWNIAGPFAGGAVVALLLGRRLSAQLAGPRLQQLFAVVSAGVALLLMARGLGWLTF